MMYREQGKNIVMFADSLPDVASYLQHTPKKWQYEQSRHNKARPEWDLGLGYEGAWRMAATGWTQGAVDMDVAVKALPPVSRTAQHKFDVAGEFPDVARYLSGDPLHMQRRGKRQGHRPVIHLVINNVASGGCSAQTLAAYGAAMTRLVDQLEEGGRRVELDVVMVNTFHGKARGLLGWKVKRAEDSIDMSAVAFSLAHPAAFRRIGFAMLERMPAFLAHPGYGQCGSFKPSDADLLGIPEALFIDGVGQRTSLKPNETLRLAIQQINEAAGEELVSVEE